MWSIVTTHFRLQVVTYVAKHLTDAVIFASPLVSHQDTHLLSIQLGSEHTTMHILNVYNDVHSTAVSHLQHIGDTQHLPSISVCVRDFNTYSIL